MTTKKILFIVVGVLVGLALIVAILTGGIIGITLYSIGQSEAAETAKTFLRNNEQLKRDIGEIKDFGSFVTGNISFKNSDGDATINIKVIGARKTVNASVDLIYRSGRPWRVVAASYQNEAGQNVDLQNPYTTFLIIPRLAA